MQYTVVAYFGNTYVKEALSSQLIHEQSGDQALAGVIIDGLVGGARKERIPLEDYSHGWVAITGSEGLRSVIGKGYRGFTPVDFHVIGTSPDTTPKTMVCRVALIPASSVPKVCGRPACQEWATYHFGVIHNPSEYSLWGKRWLSGDEIHACPLHAMDIYNQDQEFHAAPFQD